jgi:hypothetical protein
MTPSYYNTEHHTRSGQVLVCDLCVYSANSAGIAAAVEAKRRGLRVVLLNNGTHLGGLTAGGLGYTDSGNKAVVGGLSRDFYRRVGAYYGVAEEWTFEPSVAARVYRDLLQEVGVEPINRQFLATTAGAVVIEGGKIQSIRMESGLVVHASYFMDCTYEGDLMAAAGVPFTVGREGNERYGEFFNGVQVREHHQFDIPVSPWRREGDPASGLLPGISAEPLAVSGTGDRKVQAYNFRMCLTRESGIRVPFAKPSGYDPELYELLARYLRGGWRDVFYKFDLLRNGKTDTNNHGPVSTDFIGQNHDYPEAGYAKREQIFQAHVNYQQGLLWFFGNDPRVPADIHGRMNEWGLASDEFADTAHWPPQLYIREARRMISDYVFTELDCRGYRQANDPIGYGSYAMDSHNCQRVVVGDRVINEGDVQFSNGVYPYPISYRSVIPPRGSITNLFVPVCLSASHIAYGSARMEPVFMILGQSCAVAAALCLRSSGGAGQASSLPAVQDCHYPDLERELLALGQILQAPPVPVRMSPSGIKKEHPLHNQLAFPG